MLRFRRRGGFRGKKFREPRMWDRVAATSANGTSIFAAPFVTALWDPTLIIAGNQDLRLTMMRLMVDGEISVTLTGGANPSSHIVSMGIYLGSPGEVKDPSFAAAGDVRSDWLWLSHTPVFQNAASPFFAVATGALTRNLENTVGLLDVRTKRKLDQDQQVLFAIRFRDPLSAVSAATTTTQLFSSVLYQRTPR